MDWVNVEDKLPKFGVKYRYLFVNGKKEVTLGWAYDPLEGWDSGHKHLIWISDCDRQTNEVATHWMPLPNPPEQNGLD